jgi:acid stress chaperone HdeB
MKRTIISSFCALILTNIMPAHAQVVIDLSVLTCKQLLDSDAERQALISSWMGGYFNATKNLCQSALDWDPRSASKGRSDSLLMQFEGCLAL